MHEWRESRAEEADGQTLLLRLERQIADSDAYEVLQMMQKAKKGPDATFSSLKQQQQQQ